MPDSGGDVLERLGPDLVAAVRPPLTSWSSAGDVVLERLRDQIRAMLGAAVDVHVGAEDSVHRMRVATRRIRSALRTFGPLFCADLRRFDDELAWLAGVLGAARDAEVLHARLLQALATLPSEDVIGPVQAVLDARLSTADDDTRRDVLHHLGGRRYRDAVADLLALAAFPPLVAAAGARWETQLPRLVDGELRTMRRRVRAALALPSGRRRDVAFHRVRKTAKRVRYGAETLRPIEGDDARRFITRFEAVQELLGERQDAVMASDLLRTEASAAAPAAASCSYTFGMLTALESQRIEAVDAAFAATWRRLDSPKVTGWLAVGSG